MKTTKAIVTTWYDPPDECIGIKIGFDGISVNLLLGGTESEIHELARLSQDVIDIAIARAIAEQKEADARNACPHPAREASDRVIYIDCSPSPESVRYAIANNIGYQKSGGAK
jgi:hypothetical protein